MNNNLGNTDRILRLVGVVPLTMCAVAGPYPLTLRLALFALPAIYLAMTALVGSCVGYALMGRSTCKVPSKGR